jgi:hypothetical protein
VAGASKLKNEVARRLKVQDGVPGYSVSESIKKDISTSAARIYTDWAKAGL